MAKRSDNSPVCQSFQLQCWHWLFGAKCTYILSLPKTLSTAFSACEISFSTDAVFWAFNHLGIPLFVFICDNFYSCFFKCLSRQFVGSAELCELSQRCVCACVMHQMSLMVHRVMMLCAHYFHIKVLFCTTIFLPLTSFCLFCSTHLFTSPFDAHLPC